jgi:hypothetical protein
MATTSENLPAVAKPGDEGMAIFGPHVVALIDFLGQSSELAKWDFVPTTVTETAKWVPAVRDTLSRVLMWREEFEKRFAAYLQSLRQYEEQFAPSEPTELRRCFDEYRQTTIRHQHFSDTLIFYSPLQNEHAYWQVSNVAGMLVTCGALMLAALNMKTVFRGSIEVGMLTRFPPDSAGRPADPYGPALAKAHQLESKVADYPRIIIGPGLLSYLDATIKNPDTDAPAQANRAVAADCGRHVTQDTDGCWIVDYLNDTFANTGGNSAGWRQMQADAFVFVQSELARFKYAGDDQLEKRYECLQAYFCSRGSRVAEPPPT